MDAEMLREFDELASEAGAGLFPVTVVIGGVSYAGTGAEPRARGELEESVTVVTAEAWVWVSKGDLGAAPAVDAVVTAWGRDWVLREVRGAGAGDAEWGLRVEARN